MTRNGYPNSTPQQPSFSVRHTEIARDEGGSRRLFRAEVNNRLTGFVEKHFKGERLVREFALGGPRNRIDEATAKARFAGVEIKKVSPANHELPAFITQPEPLAKEKPVCATPRPKKKKVSAGSSAPTRGPRSRKDALALAGGLTIGRT